MNRSKRDPLARQQAPVHLQIAVLAALVALVSPASPTAWAISDRVFAVLFAFAAAYLVAYSRRWAWLAVAGLAASTATGWPQLAGIAALGLSLWALRLPRRSRRYGALVGGLSANALLWGSVLKPVPAAVLGTVALGCAVASTLATSRPKRRRRVIAALGAVAGIFVVFTAGYGLAAQSARSAAESGLDHLRAGLDAAQANDAVLAKAELDAAQLDLQRANDSLDQPWAKPIRALPILGPNARAVDVMAGIGLDLAQTARSAAEAADLESIDIQAGQFDLSILERVGVASDDLLVALDRATADLAAVDSPWLVGPLADRLDEAVDIIDEAKPSVTNVRDGMVVAPRLLGRDAPQRFLVLFVTPSEARGSVGYPGNFAELVTSQGSVEMVRFGRLEQLQEEGLALEDRSLSGPIDYLERYSRFAPAQSWHNIAMSPDFPSVAQVAAELYLQSGGTTPLDGVMAIDPTALAALLELTGPVQVEGIPEPISSANAVDYLQTRQYIELDKGERVDMLQEVARITFEKLTNGELPGAQQITDVLAPIIQDGHLTFVSFDPANQAILARANVDGSLPPVQGDNVAVVINNAGGNKLDAYLSRQTTYDVVWDSSSGDVSGVLTVRLENLAPSSGLPDYILGNSLTGEAADPTLSAGTNRTWVSVYSPFRYTGATLDTAPEFLQLERELDRYVMSTFVDIPPGESRTLEITLSGQLTPVGQYRLDVSKQPQARPESLQVTIQEASEQPVVSSTGPTTQGLVTMGDEAFERDLVITARTS